MTDNSIFEVDDLVYNPTPRVPVSLCLDCSGSMEGEPIQELNAGLREFYRSVSEDEKARNAAEISIVTFGPAQLELDFTPIKINSIPPVLSAFGETPMGEALQISLDTLENRKEIYKNAGVDYYQPWLVLMTDGMPYGGEGSVLKDQIARAADLVNKGKLSVFAIGIGPYADMDTLAKISPERPPLKLQGLDFSQFFTWLSKSVSMISKSMPGDRVSLDIDGIKTWAEL